MKNTQLLNLAPDNLATVLSTHSPQSQQCRMTQVQEQLAQSKARHQESEARHQQQMAEVMTRMNAMFAQLTGSSVPDLSMSQVPN